jgi:hypothetical protein
MKRKSPMRNLTIEEVEALNNGRCPMCGGIDFTLGPRGGMMQNITCARCAARFNVVTPEARAAHGDLPFGQYIIER